MKRVTSALALGTLSAGLWSACVEPVAPPAEPPRQRSTAPAPVDAAADTGPFQGCDADACSGLVGEALRDQIRERAKSAKGCFDGLLKRVPTEGGRMVVLFRLAQDGMVCSKELIENTVVGTDDEFERCIVDLYGKPFSPPEEGCARVALPLRFVADRDAGADGGDRDGAPPDGG